MTFFFKGVAYHSKGKRFSRQRDNFQNGPFGPLSRLAQMAGRESRRENWRLEEQY